MDVLHSVSSLVRNQIGRLATETRTCPHRSTSPPDTLKAIVPSSYIRVVYIRNLEFAPLRRHQSLDLFEHRRIVHVDAGHRVIRLRLLRFFFDADNPIALQFRDSEPLGIRHFLQ